MVERGGSGKNNFPREQAFCQGEQNVLVIFQNGYFPSPLPEALGDFFFFFFLPENPIELLEVKLIKV